MSRFYKIPLGVSFICLLTGCASTPRETSISNVSDQRIRVESIDIVPSPINLLSEFHVTVKLALAPGLKTGVNKSQPNRLSAKPVNNLELENATATSAVTLEFEKEMPQTVLLRRAFKLNGRVDAGNRELVAHVTCQVCSFDICFPPVELVQRKQIRVVRRD